MITQVFVDGSPLDVVSNVNLKRSSSSLVGSLTFSTPIDIITQAAAKATVIVRQGEKTYFIGHIDIYSVSYSNRALSINLTCSDDMSTLATAERISFSSGTMAGEAIVALLAGTGINTDHVALQSTTLPNDLCVYPVGSNRLQAIKTIYQRLGAVFYLRFDGVTSYAICDTWANIQSTLEMTEEVSVSDRSDCLILNFNLDPAPEDPSTARASLSFAGSPVILYNRVNLTQLYADMGITHSYDTWRVTEIDIKFSEYGITTTATLTDPDLDLSDTTVGSSYSITEQAKTTADSVARGYLSRVATVTAISESNDVTIQYKTTEEYEVIEDQS